MKRLIPLFSLLLCLSALGVNITNYPLTNNYSGNELFLLSSIPWKTNFNLPGNYVAKTSDLNSASNSILVQMPTTNGFVDSSVTNGLQGALINPLTNGHSAAVTISNALTVVGTNSVTKLVVGGASSSTIEAVNITGKMRVSDSFGTLDALYINPNANYSTYDAVWGSSFFGVKSAWLLKWSSTSSGSGSADTGLGKNSPGVVEVNTGTAGTLGSLKAASGTFSGTLTATNGVNLMVKPSFTTNFTCTTNLQAYCCDGTNQLLTLPNAASVPNSIYRFTSTNGWGSVIITNATGAQSIRDGTSLSYTNIGIGEFGVFSDGACWRLASKGRTILPSASWSSATTITPAQDVITNIPWTDLEFNNSQGLTLRTNSTFSRPTELWVTNAGTYMITFSAVLKGAAGGSVLSIWLRENGSDVARTRTDQGFSGTTAQQCMTVNYFVNVGTAPKFYELVAASHDASPPTIVGATANPTGYTAPAMPAVIVTINRVSDPWP